MDDYSIGMLSIRYDYQSSEHLDAYVKPSYEDFDTYFCNKQHNLLRLREICDNRSNFKTAGIVFIVFSSLSLAVMFYGQVYLIGRVFRSQRAFCSFRFAHIIYPAIFSLALVLYLAISQVFTLNPPSKDCSGNRCDVEAEIGLYSLFAAELASLGSLVMFLMTQKKMKILLYPPEISK